MTKKTIYRNRFDPIFIWVIGLGGLILLWGWNWQRFLANVPAEGFLPEHRKPAQKVRLAGARPAAPPGTTRAGQPGSEGTDAPELATPPAAPEVRNAWHPVPAQVLPWNLPASDPSLSPAQIIENMSWQDRLFLMDRYAYVPAQVLLKFRPEASPSDRGKVVASSLKGGSLGQLGEEQDPMAGGWILVSIPPNVPVRQALESLVDEPTIACAEPNYLQYASRTPNDPRFGELYGLHNVGQTGGTSDADIDAPEAWDLTTGGDVIVADIDTGVDYTHPDLAANMWRNPAEANGTPGVDDDGNGFVDDVFGFDFANNDADPKDDNEHGSHTSGTIAAVGNNGLGVAGVAWQAKIMAMKFLTGSGSGSTSNAVKCINYARTKGARVMSNSWGGGGFSQSLKDSVDAAAAAGILFVAAAGNESNDNDALPSFPASLTSSNVIAVAATDSRDQLASFSNFGARTVHLSAPGVGTLSTIPGGGFASFSGTSMATPHVAGVAALLVAANPAITLAEMKNAILSSVDPVPALAGKVSTGGRLNAFKAVKAVRLPGTHLTFQSQVIVDDGAAGTIGNGDGVPSPGETVRVRVTVQNRGTVAATAGSGTLASTDNRATVLASGDAFGDVASGAVATGASGFLVSLGASIPSGTALPFTLTTRASNQADEASNFTVVVFTSSSIAGRVTDALTGAVLAGAQVNFSGPRNGSVLADASGNYRVAPATDGTYSLTAGATGYATSPARSVSVPPSASSVNFALVPLASISGTVSLLVGGNPEPASGVTVKLTGAASRSATTSAAGFYSFGALGPGAYTITPQGTSLSYTPATRQVTLAGQNVGAQDFTAVSLPTTVYTKDEVPPLAIPDEFPTGVVSTLVVPEHRTISDVNVYVRIRHTYKADLRVTVRSPAGTAVRLHDQTGGSADDIDTWYDTLTAPAQSLGAFVGQDMFGTWRLEVADFVGQDVGTLERWQLEIAGPSTAGPVLSASPLSVQVRATQGTNPATVSLSITNTGSGTLSWSVTDNAPWLTASPTSGVNSGTSVLSGNTAGLAAGVYQATVCVTASGAANSPLNIPVSLEVTGTGTVPVLSVTPASLAFSPGAGGASPAPVTLLVGNLGGGSLSWSVTSNAAWLSASPASGTAGGTTAVTANTASLPAGNQSAQLTFTAAGASNSPLVVPVTFSNNDVTCPGTVLDLRATQVVSAARSLPLAISSTSGDQAGYGSNLLVDGIPATSWMSRFTSGSTTVQVTFDLGGIQTINKVRFQANPTYPTSFPRSITLRTSADGANWTTVASQSTMAPAAGTWGAIEFLPANARFVKLYVPSTIKVTGPNAYCTSLAEFEVWSVAASREDALQVAWTAPGDDGNVGRATAYDLRYSFNLITEANWSSAIQAAGEPVPASAGGAEGFLQTGLRPGRSYFFALRTVDEAGNLSAVSNIASCVTPGTGDSTPPSAVTNLGVGPAPDGVAGVDLAPATTLVSASGASSPDADGAAALDGDAGTSWRVSSATPDVDEHLVVDLGLPQTVGGFRLHPDKADPTSFPVDFELDASQDLQSWAVVTTVAGFRPADGGWMEASFPPLVARYLRLRVRELAPSAGGGYAMSLAEAGATESPAASTTALSLTWTAVGDDGLVGRAFAYDLRFATSPINTEADFQAATRATGLPFPQAAGSTESFNLRGLAVATTYFVRLKVCDDDGNVSGLSNQSSGTTSAPADLMAPGDVDDLTASNVVDAAGALPDRLQIKWTATGDDGTSGRAAGYDLRYSTSPITAASWSTATQVIGEPAPGVAGTAEVFLASGLAASTTYFFGLLVLDEMGNPSGLSNIASATTGPNRDGGAPAPVVDLRLGNVGGTGARVVASSAFASTSLSTNPPRNAIDGIATTDWVAKMGGGGVSLTLDLGALTGVGKVRMLPSNGRSASFPRSFRILTSADGSVWQSMAQVTGYGPATPGVWVEVPMAASAGRFVRVQVDAVSSTAGGYAALAEFEAYGTSPDSQTSLDVFWTATGDDGWTGTATAYDLRVSATPITASSWDTATPVAGVPAPHAAGSAERFRLTNLAPGTTYFAALRVLDEAGNMSELSNLGACATLR
ncbi:MAG: discoidin domain-containing protein [Planctomycetes bacterium]|nr:discoidin domain-containing protein [Planctomycetota bacterium]